MGHYDNSTTVLLPYYYILYYLNYNDLTTKDVYILGI